MDLLKYKAQAFGALAVKSLPLLYGGAVILFVNTHLPRDTQLGIYSLSMATFYVISALGKSFALFPLVKFQAEGSAPEGTWTAGVAYWVGSQLCGAALIWSAAPLTPHLFHAPGIDVGMRWSAALIVAFIPRDLGAALLMARREMGRLFLLEGGYFVLATGGIVLFSVLHTLGTAAQVLGFNLIGALLSTLIAPFLCLRRLPSWRKPEAAVWRRTSRYGRDSLGIGVGDLVYTQLDYHLLGLFMGAAEVALYFAAKNFFRFYNAITQALNLLIFPASSSLYARGEIDKLRELIEKVLSSYFGLLMILNLLLLMGADFIVALVYRGLFPDAANVLRLFIVASFFEPLYMVSENVLYGIGKPRAILIAMWSSLILFVLLAVTLMPRWGAMGGALTILGTLISLAVITLIFLNRELQVTPLSIARRGLQLSKVLLGKR